MRRLLLVVPALMLALGVAAACSERATGDGVASAGGDGENSADSEIQLTDEGRAQAFVDCMRERGIDLPDIDPNGEGGLADLRDLDIPREELQPALEACREFTDFGGQRDLELDQETLDQMTAFAECMRENGVDVQDPDPNQGFAFGEEGTDVMQDPDFQTAIEACEDLLAQFRPGAGVSQ